MKNITSSWNLVLAAAVIGLMVSPAVAQPKAMGTLNVTVLDENGVLVQNAPVFISGDKKTKFTGGREIPGTATLDMPAGTYRISAAVVRRSGDYTDRFASPEAFIEVLPGDNTVVTLHLRSLEDPMARMGYTELTQIGLNPEQVHSF